MVNCLKLPELNRKNLIIFSIVALALAIPVVYVYDYTQNNPKFCTTCHLMNSAYETWDQSAMHDLNCHECHESDMVESLGHVVEVLTKNPQQVTKITEVDNELCEHCHVSNDPQWLQVVNTEGHKVHFFDKPQPPYCIDCHGLRLHVFEPPEEICKECHEKSLTMGTPTMEIHCIVCHEFTTALLLPEREDCVNCHDFARLQTIMEESYHKNTQVDIDCRSCHNPHIENAYIDCTNCHDQSGYGLHDKTVHSDCKICHAPHRDTDMRDNCLTCHRDRETHYYPVNCDNCHSFDK